MPKLQDSFRSPVALQVNPLVWESELLGWPIDWTFSNEESSSTTTPTTYTDLMCLEPVLFPDHTCWSYISQFYESLPTETSLEVRSDDTMGQNFELQEQEFLRPESQLTTVPQAPQKTSEGIHKGDETKAHNAKEEKDVSYSTLPLATPEAQLTDPIIIYSDEIPRGHCTQVDAQNISVDRWLNAHQTFYNREESTSHPEVPIGQHNFLPSRSQSFASESSTRGKRKVEEPQESSGVKRVKLLGHPAETGRDIENIPIPRVSSSPMITFKSSRVYKRKESDTNPDRIQKAKASRKPLGEVLPNGLPINVLSNNVDVDQPIVLHEPSMSCVPAPEASKGIKRKQMEEQKHLEVFKAPKRPRRVAPCRTSGDDSQCKYESDDEYIPHASKSLWGPKKNQQKHESRTFKMTRELRPMGLASGSCEETRNTGLISAAPKRAPVCQVKGCGQRFTRDSDLKRHYESIHLQQTLFCPWAQEEGTNRKCKDAMARIDSLRRHIKMKHVHDKDELQRWMKKIKRAEAEGSYTPERVKSWFIA